MSIILAYTSSKNQTLLLHKKHFDHRCSSFDDIGTEPQSHQQPGTTKMPLVHKSCARFRSIWQRLKKIISLNLLSINVMFVLSLVLNSHSWSHSQQQFRRFEFVFIAKWENDILLATTQNYFRANVNVSNSIYIYLYADADTYTYRNQKFIHILASCELRVACVCVCNSDEYTKHMVLLFY